MMRRYERFASPSLGRDVELLAYGYYGPPMVAFPPGGGRFFDWENEGMIDAVRPWLDAGKLKLYCVDGIDHESWLNQGIDLGSRARRHNDYFRAIVDDVVPFIRQDCDAPDVRLAATGCSVGGYHAALAALKAPTIFNYALCLSGRYDVEALCGPSDDAEVYFNNPLAFAYHLHGDALELIRSNTHLVLVCGQGAWEDRCLAETHRLADILASKGISHERDLWGHDVEHHWYWWKKQIAYHLQKTIG